VKIKLIILFLLITSFLFVCFCSKKDTSINQFITFKKISEIGISEGDENYIFGSINDVEVDELGNIYILDGKMSRIVKFAKNGEFICKFGKKGQGPGEFQFPEAVVLDSNRLIYVLGSRRVLVFNEHGKFVHSFPYNFYGVDIAIDNEQNLILLGPRDDKIFQIYDRKGNYLYSFGNGFKVPDEFAKFREARFSKFPIRLWTIEDEVYILNPYEYEIHIYKNGTLKENISKKTPNYLRPELKQISPGGYAGYISDNLIHKRGNKLFVFYNGKTANWLDIFENGKFLKSLEMKNNLKAIDYEGKFYFAEEEDYLKLVISTLGKDN